MPTSNDKELTYIFRDRLYSKLAKNMTSNSNQFVNYVSRYIDKNNEVLYDIGPANHLYYTDADREITLKCSGLDLNEIKQCIKECPEVSSKWIVLGDPYNYIYTLIIRYYLLNKKEKEMKLAIIYFALKHYSALQASYFKYKPNRNVMDYTVNNLSNKFNLKKLGNVLAWVSNTANQSHKNLENELKIGSDRAIKNYITSMQTRINDTMNTFYNEFIKNLRNGNYLNPETDINDEETGQYYETNNISNVIATRVQDIMTKTISQGIDMRLIKIAGNANKISLTNLKNVIITITTEKTLELKELYRLILSLYLGTGKNREDYGIKFINYCVEIYSKSNTNDKDIMRIKEILDKWLMELNTKYAQTEREAFKSGFRKSIYLYFVFLIQKYSK